eukprot:596408-Prorocentrum_lima.AAC.1
MTSSLVGSEMCIRDRGSSFRRCLFANFVVRVAVFGLKEDAAIRALAKTCLLYTSDAADDM